MQAPGRHGSLDSYRYGFNGKEKDDEIKGEGAQYDYGFRIYDPRLGKFLSIDPLFQSYPYYTPYQFAGNNPIWAIDLDGLEQLVTNQTRRVQNFSILDGSNEPIEGVVDVVYWNTNTGSLVREYRQTGTYVLNEGYEGGPQIIEDIVLKRQAQYAPDISEQGGKFRRMFRYTNTITPISATQSPPEQPYVPKSFDTPIPEPEIKTIDKKPIERKVPVLKTGSATALMEGTFYPTIDEDGIDFVDQKNNQFPAKDKLQSIVNGINSNPEINTVKLSGSLKSGDGVSKFKVKNSMIMGLNKLRSIMKGMGLRNGVNFEININDVKAPDIDGSPESKTEINFEFLKKS